MAQVEAGQVVLVADQHRLRQQADVVFLRAIWQVVAAGDPACAGDLRMQHGCAQTVALGGQPGDSFSQGGDLLGVAGVRWGHE
ncbi:hypothetical protein D3C78_999420 [compost metagenome]